jgi:hypothetical protein
MLFDGTVATVSAAFDNLEFFPAPAIGSGGPREGFGRRPSTACPVDVWKPHASGIVETPARAPHLHVARAVCEAALLPGRALFAERLPPPHNRVAIARPAHQMTRPVAEGVYWHISVDSVFTKFELS